MSNDLNKIEIQAIQPSRWNQDGLNEILTLHREKKILVVGDIGVDRYTIGTVERISPEAPVPIVLVTEEKLKLGLAANVADNIQALGGIPLLIGVLGSDRGAEDFRELMKSNEILSSYLVVDPSRRTVLKERVVSEGQQLVRIDYETLYEIESKIEEEILNRFQELIHDVDGVILEDYAKGLITPTLMRSIFKISRQAGKTVVVDPNSKTPADFYRGATVLTPNTKEAEHLSGVPIRDQSSLIQAGFKILETTESDDVVITRGKDGMAIFSRKNSLVRLIPTYAREVYDVSGAGDTVISVLTLSLASGATIEDAAILGNLAAGVEVGKRGTATVSPDEIREALKIFHD